ncbi:MAG TPA: HAMP domain-containing sensor histidine kinase [Dictyobacter sp.]|nr:HAMP domain-containing sensor histidine kinase [Dictyobacter sp.]
MKVRSFGGKLIVVTSLMFVICLTFFTVLSWSILLLYTHQSNNHIAISSLLALFEPTHTKPRLLIIGIAILTLGFSILLYTLVTHVLFLKPLQQLQAYAQALVTSTTGTPLETEQEEEDEIHLLTRTLSLLTTSLQDESQAVTTRMSNLLTLHDALMSTLNLEQLLGEFVTRIGTIMKVKHVALYLYGREANSLWAVAHWSGPVSANVQNTHTSSISSQTLLSVYVSPDEDIANVITKKLQAIPSSLATRKPASTYPRQPETKFVPPTLSTPLSSSKHSRIPPQAIRELDIILTRMAIQRQKIMCAEDIPAIHQEHKDRWTHMALKAGYQSAIAVPLLLQDQAIGAFILYDTHTNAISHHESFLLSTAALQTTMAIENALLFAEANEKNTALEHANQLKSQFLANVTHELRTPLHSIISYGALILEGFVDGSLTAEQEQHIQFIVRRAEDLSHLVDDMLDLSKIEADRIEVKLEALDLPPCLAEVIEQLKPLARSKELILRLETESNLPLALADSHRIRQVLINLVSNALKFTEKGNVTIRCSRIPQLNLVCVAVSDTGIGISPAALSYIFEAFRQADGSTTRSFGGTGLGLTIAKKLVELQGGEISVESVPGEGTTFSFLLPIASSS